MRIVHLADLHLGYRAYNRITSQGINRREADVFNAFRSALAKTVEIRPDLIVIAGDLFHTVRPSNLCIQQSFGAFLDLRLKQNLQAPIVIIGGNHDSPRSVDTGCILDLLTKIPDVYVVHHDYEGIKIPQLETTVFCLCHRALPELSQLKLEPDPASRYNILTLHGSIEGVTRNFSDIYPIQPSQALNDSWDYIALGHYHIHTKLRENAYYSGSTEFTSFNIWEEAAEPKGFIEYDTDTRLAVFHQLETRPVIDLREIDARDIDAQRINEMIERRIDGIDGRHQDKIIRLVIENIPRQVQVDLDFALIRQIKAEALHFELQCRPPKRDSSRGSQDRAQTRPLEDEWREYVEASSDLPGGVKRSDLVDIGLAYLGRQEAAPE
ncbi:MAG: exonuclease SbcCD subunit D [Armatimonadota bacterium]|nr:exonuclease SbcCD subunit D [Armatimonadota bacterium]